MSPGRGKTKGTGKKKQPKRKRHVKVKNLKRVDLNNCVANPDTLPLRKSHGDQALWKSADGQGYDITFATSPFRKSAFRVDPNRTTPSGPIKSAAYGYYKYTVDGDNGCHQDPRIRIGP
jgi:hypothetical protein